MTEQTGGEERAYVVLDVQAPATEPTPQEPRPCQDIGRYVATSSDEAIHKAILASAEPSARYVAVAERNWIERPVRRRVQPSLFIGDSEFALDAVEESEER